MLSSLQKQIISEFYDDYEEDLKNGNDEYNELIESLKEEEDYDNIESGEIDRYIEFLKETEGEDIEESLDYWQEYLWEMERNCDYKNANYELASKNVGKFKALVDKYAEFLN